MRFSKFLIVTILLMVVNDPVVSKQIDLKEVLAPVVSSNPLPALAAIVFDDQKVIASGAIGVRKFGDPTLVTIEDSFHLGSCTKAMTATLAARIVERGDISWTTTVKEALGLHNVDSALENITLLELMSHTAGMPASLRNQWPNLYETLFYHTNWQKGPKGRAARRMVAQLLFFAPPAQAVGSYKYSNAGFMVAGAMLEAVTDTEWEDLMRTELFKPLGMKNCGFGPAARPDKVDQPWPHSLINDKPVLVTREWITRTMHIRAPESWGNPRSLGPAGSVSCTISDWAKFGQLHLGDGGDFISTESMSLLHEVRNTSSRYALGWYSSKPSWAAGGTALTHNGSNLINFAIVRISPTKKKGVMVATNIDSGKANGKIYKILNGVVGQLIQAYF
ncbi:MAG: beta-lactamase family protein [Rhodospirillales bacterium]|nr:beta-lactamase family protein [Rhodospirillales bacterium]